MHHGSGRLISGRDTIFVSSSSLIFCLTFPPSMEDDSHSVELFSDVSLRGGFHAPRSLNSFLLASTRLFLLSPSHLVRYVSPIFLLVVLQVPTPSGLPLRSPSFSSVLSSSPSTLPSFPRSCSPPFAIALSSDCRRVSHFSRQRQMGRLFHVKLKSETGRNRERRKRKEGGRKSAARSTSKAK